MTVIDDIVTLAWWNGRPTVMLEVIEGQPRLSWLIIGHAEDYDVWFHTFLSWDQADELCQSRPGGFNLDQYFASQDRAIDGNYLLVAHGRAQILMSATVAPAEGLVRYGTQVLYAELEKMHDAKLASIKEDLAQRMAA